MPKAAGSKKPNAQSPPNWRNCDHVWVLNRRGKKYRCQICGFPKGQWEAHLRDKANPRKPCPGYYQDRAGIKVHHRCYGSVQAPQTICRNCKRRLEDLARPPDEHGIIRQGCSCGANGRIYLGRSCKRCFIEELTFRLWKEAGQPDKAGPYKAEAYAEFHRLRTAWQENPIIGEAEGAAAITNLELRAIENARRLLNITMQADEKDQHTRQLPQ